MKTEIEQETNQLENNDMKNTTAKTTTTIATTAATAKRYIYILTQFNGVKMKSEMLHLS